MIELTEDERDWIADVWDEDTTASAGAFYPVVARIIAARVEEALAPVRALTPPLPIVGIDGMVHHDEEPNANFSHSIALVCDRCTGFPHTDCVPAAALRAALPDDETP